MSYDRSRTNYLKQDIFKVDNVNCCSLLFRRYQANQQINFLIMIRKERTTILLAIHSFTNLGKSAKQQKKILFFF